MDRLKKYIFPAVMVAAIAVFATLGRVPQTNAEYLLDRKPEVIAATFSSAWCSSCKILEPRLGSIVPKFSADPVKFVKLDFSFGQNSGLADIAAENNFADTYQRFKGATGFTLLIDAETGQILDRLTINQSERAMTTIIAQAIAVASRDSEPEPSL